MKQTTDENFRDMLKKAYPKVFKDFEKFLYLHSYRIEVPVDPDENPAQGIAVFDTDLHFYLMPFIMQVGLYMKYLSINDLVTDLQISPVKALEDNTEFEKTFKTYIYKGFESLALAK